jgi:hypothetical protein
MIERYHRYRSYGHSVFVSMSLAPTAMQIIVCSSIVGLIIGVLL